MFRFIGKVPNEILCRTVPILEAHRNPRDRRLDSLRRVRDDELRARGDAAHLERH